MEATLLDLAVCAEMVFLDLPFEQRVRRIAEAGLQVEIWNWKYHDIDTLVQTGARFSSMVGHTAGSLLDDDGANAFLQGAEESLGVAERLDCRVWWCSAPNSAPMACRCAQSTRSPVQCGSTPIRRCAGWPSWVSAQV
jgi:hypothetical protein